MALLEEQFTEKLDAGASPITYEGNEGKEQQIAQALWDKLPPQVRMQFGNFSQFFSSGAWKKVLAALQQQMQGGQEEIQETETETIGRAPQEGLGALMQGPRPMAFGGRAASDGRQAYGLGSIFKKITRPIKKIVKSPLGKAALLYAGTAGLGNLMAGAPQGWGVGAGKGLGWLGPKAAMSNLGAGFLGTPSIGDMDMTGGSKGFLAKLGIGSGWGSPLSSAAKWGLGIGAATAAPFAMQATGNWEDEKLEDLKLKAAEFGFDYGEMIRDIQGAVDSGDEENVMRVMVKYNLSRGDMPKAKYIGTAAEGGRIGAQEGGLMNLGGMEKDYRQEGGFVPIGGKEKADDVPARLSRNEFVFTADAVRAAGGGDIDQGAEVMENVMKNLEGGGRISEESQGQGARDMFQVSERLSEVV